MEDTETVTRCNKLDRFDYFLGFLPVLRTSFHFRCLISPFLISQKNDFRSTMQYNFLFRARNIWNFSPKTKKLDFISWQFPNGGFLEIKTTSIRQSWVPQVFCKFLVYIYKLSRVESSQGSRKPRQSSETEYCMSAAKTRSYSKL